MKLRNLFKPKLLEARITEPNKLKEGLVYAIQNYKTSSIFLYVDGKNDILLGERWHVVSSLCVHNNWLYDGGYKIENYGFFHELNQILGFVIDTITGKDIMKRERNTVYSLCSHNGVLYRGDYNGIFEVLTGKKIADRWGVVTSICSHEGVLYDCGARMYSDNRSYEGVYDTLKQKIVNKKYPTKVLCSYEGTLYGVGYDQNAKSFGSWYVFDILKNKKIAERTYVEMLFSYKGTLYDGNAKRINTTLSYEHFPIKKEGRITAVCSIPPELEEQIKHTKNYGLNFNEIQRINPKGFIEYLTNVSDSQERRRIIEQLFNYEYVNEDVIKWLDKNENDIMRKAAFY